MSASGTSRASSLLRRLRRALDYLDAPELLRARRAGVRVDFVGELLDLRRRFGFVPGTVVDVGANRGDYVRAVRHALPDAQIHAFEPIPALAERLERELGGPECRIFAYALDAEGGTRDFYLTQADDLSSLLPPTAELARSLEGGDAHTRSTRIRIEARRLDDVLDLATAPAPVLLKLDVQGGELRTLRGASRQLAHVGCVKLEHHFDRFYEGQSELAELVAFLAGHGFARVLQSDVKISESRLRWCDFLFFR